MADTKITALSAITTVDPANDVLPIVDVSDTSMAASGTTKKITTNQILGASGTATLASATITGDLTVDTNTLKVDSANNRVGIGTAAPAAGYSLDVAGNVRANSSFQTTDGTNTGVFGTNVLASGVVGICSGTNVPLVFGVNATEQMRLNSTGLGLGGIAAGLERFVVFSGASKMMSIDTNGTFFADGGTGKGRVTLENSSATNSILSTTTLFGSYNILKTAASQHQWFLGGSTQAMTLDASGNLGIGVTPSAWVAGAKALQFGAYGALAQSSSGNIELSFNSYNSGAGAYKYLQTDTASLYRASSVHSWFVAPSGTAGNAITFTQAMTLESTGSLVLGAAAVATTATDGFLYIPGCAGTPTGTPTAKTGRVPLVVDTTNNKLYFYSGGAWVAAN